MNKSQLTTFVIVAKHMNFSEAAKELYISQPTVSHQISSLEKEIGAPLFIRNSTKNKGGGVSLTKCGELFLEDTKDILGMTEDALERIRLAKENPDLSLSIAYLLAPCHSFLPGCINAFREQHPQVDLTIHRMNGHEISEALTSQRYDLFFSMVHDLKNQSQYATKTIFLDTMCLVFPNSHPCAVTGKIDYNMLASDTFLTLNPNVGPYVRNQALRLCHSMKYFPTTIRELDSMEEILFEVEAGFGITIVPARNQLSYQFPLTYIPLDGPYAAMSIGVAWMQNSENPAVSWFLQSLDEYPASPNPKKRLSEEQIL